jgi:hypothetical protein
MAVKRRVGRGTKPTFVKLKMVGFAVAAGGYNLPILRSLNTAMVGNHY